MVEEEAKEEEEEEEGAIAIHMQAGGAMGGCKERGRGWSERRTLRTPLLQYGAKKVVVESNFGGKESFLPLLHVCVWRISA